MKGIQGKFCFLLFLFSLKCQRRPKLQLLQIFSIFFSFQSLSCCDFLCSTCEIFVAVKVLSHGSVKTVLVVQWTAEFNRDKQVLGSAPTASKLFFKRASNSIKYSFLNGPFPATFLYICLLRIAIDRYTFENFYYICWDSNRGSLVSEATNLPTAPQPRPLLFILCKNAQKKHEGRKITLACCSNGLK